VINLSAVFAGRMRISLITMISRDIAQPTMERIAMLTRDFMSAKERLASPLKKWVSENVKDLLLATILMTALFIVLTKPGVIL
jgi:hypothetical protein